jgi:hypothetical protein
MKRSLQTATRFRKREDDGSSIYEPDRTLEQMWRIDWKREGLPYCGVYVISTDSLTPCKVGVSVNPSKRLATLQTSHWRELQVSEYRWCETVADAGRVEKEAHNILRANGKALLGEWFDVRPTEAVEIIEWAALTVGAAIHAEPPNDSIRQRLQEIASLIGRNRDVQAVENMEKEIWNAGRY